MGAISQISIMSLGDDIADILANDASNTGSGRTGDGLALELRSNGRSDANWWAAGWHYLFRNLQGKHDCIYHYDMHTRLYRAYGDTVGVGAKRSKPALESQVKYCVTRGQGNANVFSNLSIAFPQSASKINLNGIELYTRVSNQAMVDASAGIAAL